MKTVIAVILGSTMALSFTAEATPCKDIGAAVVDQFIAVAGYKTETPEQISAYNGLVDSQIASCESGKRMRLRGQSAESAATSITLAAAKAVDKGTASSVTGFTSVTMTQTSFSYGYAFGE